MALDGRLEATAGIRSSPISSGGPRALVLRRPGARDLVDRFWQGRWTLGMTDPKRPSAVRLYRIPDSMVQLEMTPGLPWWLNEQVQVRARLLDRHRKETPESQDVPPSDDGRGLSIHLQASLADGKGAFVVDQGRWTIPGRLYETQPFLVRAPGLYKLTGELRHTVADANAPLLRFASDLYVHPECVSLEVVSVATNDVLQVASPTATKLQIDAQGGQEVYFRITGKGEFKVEPLSGVLHLEPLPQTQWTLRKDDHGNLITGPIPLIEREERLTGSADVEVRTFAGVRHICLPVFELAYAPALTRLACTFTDPREALWVGELHRQPLLISAFPVFDRDLNQTLDLFPDALSGAWIRTIDMRSGTTQVVSPENRLLERPQAGGAEGRTVTATYFVESTVPVPPADKCEIDLSGTIENLQGAMKTYAVVDPVAQGLFEWVVTQGDAGQRQGPISDTLFCGEPIRFFAVWRPDQNVSAVRFEIAGLGAAGSGPQGQNSALASGSPTQNSALGAPSPSLFVDMPVAAGASKVQLEQVVSGLTPGQVLGVYVHVTMQPGKTDHALQIKLKGGQFRTEDRRFVLTDLTVGDGTPADIPGYVWEPVQVPLEALFRGYKADDVGHNAAIEQFKKSCGVTVTSRAGAQKITDAIQWTSLIPAEGTARTCRLIGHVTCTPEVLGRLSLELSAETPLVRGATGPSSQRALAHVLVKEPRLTIAVSRLKPGGAEPVFDSRTWVKGHSSEAPLATRLSTRLRVDVQSSDWAATGQARPWKTTLRLLRRPAAGADWVTAFSDTGELSANLSFTREVQIAENGQYALEVVGQDQQSSRPTMYVLTPIIASIQPHEITPAAAPPSWLTARVRQWPFEYHVTLHQDAVDLSRLQALAFQFQLPGQGETWLDGATAPLGPETTATRQLSAKGPRLLPAAETLRDGVARFRLSSQGLEVLRWECPNIRVLPPVLEGLALSGETTGAAWASDGGMLTLDGSHDLWVRPRFRVAPELEGQWSAAQTVVYVWRNSEEGPAGRPADVRVLERLQEQRKSRRRVGSKELRPPRQDGDGGGQGSAPAHAAGLLGLAQTRRQRTIFPGRLRRLPAAGSSGILRRRIRDLAGGSDGGRVERRLRDPSGCALGGSVVLVAHCGSAAHGRGGDGAAGAGPQSQPAGSGYALGRQRRGRGAGPPGQPRPGRSERDVLGGGSGAVRAVPLRPVGSRGAAPGAAGGPGAGLPPRRRAGPSSARGCRGGRSDLCPAAAQFVSASLGVGRDHPPHPGQRRPGAHRAALRLDGSRGPARTRLVQSGRLAGVAGRGPDPVNRSGPSVSDRQRRSNHAGDGPGAENGSRGVAAGYHR